MNIDLGYLGKVVLQEIEPCKKERDCLVILKGYTNSGICVYGVVDQREWLIYPTIYNQCIFIKVN